LSPFFLIAMLLSNVLLAGELGYRVLLLGQIAFYALAIVGSWVVLPGWAGRLLRLPALFTTVNLALLVGFTRWLRRPQSGVWVRTSREAGTSAAVKPDEAATEMSGQNGGPGLPSK
jgi:membrane protein implicated in regulation of membrane protease activity